VIAEYYELAQPDRPVQDIMLATLHATTTPSFIAALTTVLGFFSLVFNQIVSIRELGLYGSMGISFAFLLSVVFVPAMLVLLPFPARRAEAFAPGVAAVLRRLAQAFSHHRRPVITIALLVVGVSLWRASAIHVGSDFQSFFRESDPIRQATDAINRSLVGSMTFYVIVEGDEKDIVKKWETLWRIKNLQLYIDSLPGVGKTVSFVDYCELLDHGIQEIPAEPPEGEILEPPPPEVHSTFLAEP
jgi:predicted RND superfamily exporter protein